MDTCTSSYGLRKKLLTSVREPMAKFGNALELRLNLISINGGLVQLVLEEEPSKNYFNVLYAMPKVLNAVWELIPGFILPHAKGSEYPESLFFRVIRAFVGMAKSSTGLGPHGAPLQMGKILNNFWGMGW
ncbi:hypothetical protein WN944_008563 [Citrus x changshan-huyou]|uniref:Uncharacterized protein n=1 Tax=Citrus x changshan-huyou TaxID=2935761 RepID=A0AAP0QW06_9ROSI